MMVALFGAGCQERGAVERACTPPPAAWPKPHPHMGPDIPTFRVSLDRNGAIYLDGEGLRFSDLSLRLQEIAALRAPEPAVILETEMGVPCKALDEVRVLMNQRLACDKGGHCDEGVQTVWQDLPYTGRGVP